jgi:hypothetical protein
MRQGLALTLAALMAAGCARAAAFSAKVDIMATQKRFAVAGEFTGSAGIDPLTQPVTFRMGAFSITIPAGSFHRDSFGQYVFGGPINGTLVTAGIRPQSGNQYAYGFLGMDAERLPTENPVEVQLTIGSYGGDASVTAKFEQ